jgi:hypothetical protein
LNYAAQKGHIHHNGYRGRVGSRKIYQEGHIRDGGGDRYGTCGGFVDDEQEKIKITTMTEEAREEEVPLFKKWSHWYALVIGFLLLCIFLFYFLTKHFS